MVYRESKSAIEQARTRLAVAQERLDLARAQVGIASNELARAQQTLELARKELGEAVSSVRKLEALGAAMRGPADLEAKLREAKMRLEAARGEIPVCVLVIAERREELRRQRREMGAAERERAQAERELSRLEQ